ncbi:MAG: prepilin-type N-terminal cleavage/methylation domain-containing protein [Candidatus Omnitrophota bacterium]|jgi:type II secretion system protein G|nr:MAG: prepilin-type N-terminal cleavage/methylation domain-containing protein [Candidatus Omnitrophota bacterium]
MKHPRAFTLIELLIVVAIIGILAAIAVPNFMNAQIRAKVARAYSDQRAIATSYDMYNLDNNGYPFKGGSLWGSDTIYPMITTPIAYIATIPLDPFLSQQAGDSAQHNHWFFYPSWNVREVVKAGWTWGYPGVHNAVKSGSVMLILTSGPDKHEDISSQAEGILPYHTSNGLISEGDIYRFTPGTQSGS